MDEKFLEFWGNLMINAARGKKQTDEIFRWMKSGFPDFNDNVAKQAFPDFKEWSEMFQKLYGLDQLSSRSEDYQKMSDKALHDFKKSFKDYLDLMGIVSREDHLDLVEKYEKLKKKCAEQEETIKHLRMILDSRKISQTQKDVSSQFQDIVKTQGELFQNMLKDFSEYFSKTEVNPKKEDSERGEQEND